jgi:hypothetical protein
MEVIKSSKVLQVGCVKMLDALFAKVLWSKEKLKRTIVIFLTGLGVQNIRNAKASYLLIDAISDCHGTK